MTIYYVIRVNIYTYRYITILYKSARIKCILDIQYFSGVHISKEEEKLNIIWVLVHIIY